MNYLIYGSSFNLIEDEVKKILKGKHAERYSLEDTPFEDILENLSYASMFEEEKIIVLRNAEILFGTKAIESSLKAINNYLDNPNETTTIIFTSLDKISTKKETKEVLSKIKVIETPVISKPYELTTLFGNTIRQSGYGISENALNLFIEKCAFNYDIALSEFKKLKMIKTDQLITEKDIEEYISNYNLNDIFGFKDAVINKNIKKALKMLDDLESAKMELIPLTVMIAKEYELVYDIKLLTERKLTNDQISKELGNMHPYRVKVLKETGFKYTVPELEKIINELCDLDLAFTSRDNLGYDDLRMFIISL